MEERISIGARLTQLAGQQPDKPAVTDKDRTVTWRELDRRTNRLARALEKRQISMRAQPYPLD